MKELRRIVEGAGLPWPGVVGSAIQLFESQVVVEPDRGADDTRLSVNHRLPQSSGSNTGQLLFTTRRQRLSPAVFEGAAVTINAASHERGRRIFCIDTGDQSVISAMSYHVHQKRIPVLVTAIAILKPDSPRYETSLASAVVIKAYLHVLGSKLRRSAAVDMNASRLDEEIATLLEFRPAPVPRGFSDAVQTYVRQQPLW